MNRPTLITLIALNTVFASALVSEWVSITDDSTTQITPKKNAEVETEELPSLDLEETSEEEYSDLVERPLFIEGRKPVDEPAPENEAVATKKLDTLLVWDLTGIFKTPKGITAVFNRTNTKVPKDNYRKCKIGDELDSWKVSAIHNDDVILTQANETKTLLLRKPKLKTSTPIPVNSTPPQTVPPQLQTQQGKLTQIPQTPAMIPENTESQTDENVEPEQ